MAETIVDFAVVGSGAGGGPVVANLVRAGFTVALFEAGADPAIKPDGSPNYHYLVPALHGRSTEDPLLKWDFFVEHYVDPNEQKRDSKYVPAKGILYPRAGTLGGCTAHNAMITVYPHNEDWDRLASLTNDPSWSAESMRAYFEKLEDCRYSPPSPNSGRHGFGGWLSTSLADPSVAFGDRQLLTVIAQAAAETIIEQKLGELEHLSPIERLERMLAMLGVHLQLAETIAPRLGATAIAVVLDFTQKLDSLRSRVSTIRRLAGLLPGGLQGAIRIVFGDLLQDILGLLRRELPIAEFLTMLQRYLDPNDVRVAQGNLEGVFGTPLATNGFQRNGTREAILQVANEFPNRLQLHLNVLVTKVLFDQSGERPRAVGLEYIEGASQYRASANPAAGPLPAPKTIQVRREVIVSGGAFNTPQLLMLSGIGPKQVLEDLHIAVLIDLPGVGENLQDRYEVGVVTEMTEDFPILQGATFEEPQAGVPDPAFDEWKNLHRGLYTTNGVVLSIIKRSTQAETPAPDLFIFGIPGFFKGYYPQFSGDLLKQKNLFTWAILKAHTRNRAGSVRLKSADPRDTPVIQFRYFEEGSPGHEKDLATLVEGVRFVERIMSRTGMLKKMQILPGHSVDDDAKLAQFIHDEAWGHHACGTCKIGTSTDPMSVLDGDFRVRGVDGLRVVDASIFPEIPGFFIVTPIYMIAEKASEVIRRANPI